MGQRIKMHGGVVRLRTRDEAAEKTQVSARVANQIAPRRQITSDIRGADKRVKDTLQNIRDGQSTIAGMNKAAADLWGSQRAAQDAVFK